MAKFLASFSGQPDLAQFTEPARRILATAAALFLTQGAGDTSVRDITQACGLSPGALYNHFRSRDDVLFVIVEHGHARMTRRIDAGLAAAPSDAPSQVAAFVRAYVVGHVSHPELAQVVRREYLHLTPERYRTIVDVRRGIRRRLTTLIAAGADDGSLSIIGDPLGQALMVLDMCSRTSDWFDPSRDRDAATLVDQYVVGALRLVGADPIRESNRR